MRLIPLAPAAITAAIGLAAAPAPAWADTPVEISGGDEEMREAIAALLPDRDRPESLFDAERIAEEAASRAMAWLRSEGYYGARVTPEADEEPPRARLIIEPGPLFLFDTPSIAYQDAAPDEATARAVSDTLAPIQTNQPARAISVLETEAAALATLHNAGYPDAEAGERSVVVDHATSRVSAELRLSAGARARLGAVRVEPSETLRASFVDDLQNWDDGALYTPRALSRLRRDITGTGAISRANTRLGEPDANGVRDVIVDVEPARRNAYELGLGYSTTEGALLEAEWTRRNYTRRADALSVSLALGEMLQSINGELSRPHAAGLGRTRNYGATLAREESEAFTRQGVALYYSIDAAPRLAFAQSYGLQLSADTFDNVGAGVSNAYVLSGFWDVRRDSTEIRLDPRDGSVVDLRLEPSVAAGDASLGFVRAIADARIYESFGEQDRITLAARARTGWLEAVAGNAEDIPADRRFYAGGGGSVRGYAYNSIYPEERDLLGLTQGGQGMLETSAELRWRFGERWGAAAFVDGGNAFDSWEEAGDLRWGAGVGLRYNLGFAPLRVDIAFPLDDSETDDDYAFYISLGQAF